MKHSTYRGHKTKEIPIGVWVYSDTLEKVSDNKDRPCGHCNMPNRKDCHDACIGELEGVLNACCGHGNDLEAYVQYEKESNE